KQEQAATDGVPHAFDVLLELDVADSVGSRRERLRITERNEQFAIPCATRPSYVVVDPGMRVLGDVRLKLPSDMLRQQLQKAPTARGRWLAARGLKTFDHPTTGQGLSGGL